ncbi:MAG: glycoside hydrolase family 5 protein [Thermoguttaceae bacterium]|jgi:hypothetical protein
MKNYGVSRREFLKYGSGFAAAAVCGVQLPNALGAIETPAKSKRPLPPASWNKLPRWRGFNLCEKFTLWGNAPFNEDDFRNISDLGFNFARLPMDYRIWIEGDDKRKFNEQAFEEIDQAIDYGQKYGVHVMLNFHRAPGYTVNTPPEEQSVWSDADILDVCRLHWQTFAKRYAGISNDNLSFNLFNEPAGCSEEDYYRVAKTLVEGIRAEDPERLVVCDGIDWGGKPCLSFKDLKVAQATRGYAPMEVSHSGASWVNSRDFPDPQWPFSSFNGLVPCQSKRELPEDVRKPLTINGPFDGLTELRFVVGIVSSSAELVVRFDGVEAFRRKFVSGPGEGEWKEAIYSEAYNIYANIFDMELGVPIPKNAQKIELTVVDGDWLSLKELKLVASDGSAVSSVGSVDWQTDKQTILHYTVENGQRAIKGGLVRDRAWLFENNVKPWIAAQKEGIGVMVGEFGAYNKTPHKIVLDWMEDMLANWRDAGWGWALWNFRGSFGVADSGRQDAEYEEWRGIQVDRKMLELLQRY